MNTRTLDDRSQASHPGGIRLSEEKARRFEPGLYEPRGVFRLLGRLSPWQRFYQARLVEHLLHGDSRAAVVMSVSPLLVAAYTDELDCIAMLGFPAELVQEYGLQVGSRLLTVNLYVSGREPVADLDPGPASYGRYKNFGPAIAEFLSDDREQIEARKRKISEQEWAHTVELGRAYLARYGPKARDGRPLESEMPAFFVRKER
jgi:hypothetical protein